MAPPVIVPKRRQWWPVWLIVGLSIASCITCLVGYTFLIVTWGMFMPRAPGPNDYARGQVEKEVSPSQIGVEGTVLLAEPDGLLAINVANLTHEVLASRSGEWVFFGCAGPNRNGLVVYIDNNMMAKKHRFHVVDTKSRTDRVLFERDGDALWDSAVTSHLAIADDVDVAVFQDGVGHEQLYDPQRYMNVCNLERVELDTGKSWRSRATIYDGPIALDPRGRYAFGVGKLPGRSSSGQVSAIMRLDTASDAVEPIAKGEGLVNSPTADGGLVIWNEQGRIIQLDSKGRNTRFLSYPNYVIEPIAFLSSGIVIARAKPRRLEDVQMTQHNGLPGPRPMSRIVAIDSKRKLISTLYMPVDPRTVVTYSPWPKTQQHLESESSLH